MEHITEQLKAAQAAKKAVQRLTAVTKKSILTALSTGLRQQQQEIIAANALDLAKMDPQDPKVDRLLLDAPRIEGLADAVRAIAELPDPTGQLIVDRKLDNGLLLRKLTVALGVVAVIYESRPNVTIDVAALCLQSGNVCLLRGGTDAFNTNTILVHIIQEALRKAGVNPLIVQLLPADRKFVMELLTATQYVDIIIPRGSQSLIDYVRQHAKVPVIETGAGVCHTFVDATADLPKAVAIVANAKISRPSVCNALDTILVHSAVLEDFINLLVTPFKEASIEVFADPRAYLFFKKCSYPYLQEASEADYGREFLSLKCSVSVVDDLAEALAHIACYSSKHSECIISADASNISEFMNDVDAAAVYTNASTRFTDGGEFGLGAEIGISTQKLHARGPFALEKLVTEKWFVTGNGQIR